MPQRIKYRSDYTSLQAAFTDLQPQDTLFFFSAFCVRFLFSNML